MNESAAASESDTAEAGEARSSRSRFLKQVGVTLAAAVGFGALAARASASPFMCCPNAGCGSCESGNMSGSYCFCDCTGTGTNSYCWQIQQGCVTGTGCIACPC